MAEAVIVSAVRTPIGRANKGVLKDVRADDLAAIAVKAAVERVPQLDRSLIEDVILGCAFPEGEQGMNLARLVGALAGLPETAAGVTVNRFCASSLQAVNMAAQNIMLGQGDAYVAGGVERLRSLLFILCRSFAHSGHRVEIGGGFDRAEARRAVAFASVEVAANCHQ